VLDSPRTLARRKRREKKKLERDNRKKGGNAEWRAVII
jgi:hypothetical protein